MGPPQLVLLPYLARHAACRPRWNYGSLPDSGISPCRGPAPGRQRPDLLLPCRRSRSAGLVPRGRHLPDLSRPLSPRRGPLLARCPEPRRHSRRYPPGHYRAPRLRCRPGLQLHLVEPFLSRRHPPRLSRHRLFPGKPPPGNYGRPPRACRRGARPGHTTSARLRRQSLGQPPPYISGSTRRSRQRLP